MQIRWRLFYKHLAVCRQTNRDLDRYNKKAKPELRKVTLVRERYTERHIPYAQHGKKKILGEKRTAPVILLSALTLTGESAKELHLRADIFQPCQVSGDGHP